VTNVYIQKVKIGTKIKNIFKQFFSAYDLVWKNVYLISVRQSMRKWKKREAKDLKTSFSYFFSQAFQNISTILFKLVYIIDLN